MTGSWTNTGDLPRKRAVPPKAEYETDPLESSAGSASQTLGRDADSLLARIPETFKHYLRIDRAPTDMSLADRVESDTNGDHAWHQKVITAFLDVVIEARVVPGSLAIQDVMVEAKQRIYFPLEGTARMLPSSLHYELPEIFAALHLKDRAILTQSLTRAQQDQSKPSEIATAVSMRLDEAGDTALAWCEALATCAVFEPPVAAFFARMTDIASYGDGRFDTALTQGVSLSRLGALRTHLNPERLSLTWVEAARFGQDLPAQMRNVMGQLSDGNLPFDVNWRLDPESRRQETLSAYLVVLALVSVGLAILTGAALLRGGWFMFVPALALVGVYATIVWLYLRGR